MDVALKELTNIAAKRGDKYVKGGTVAVDLQSKLAELGVLLLEKAGRFPDLDETKTREELIEIQNKLDDLRKVFLLQDTAALKPPCPWRLARTSCFALIR